MCSAHVYKYTTNPPHMPEHLRRHGTWTPNVSSRWVLLRPVHRQGVDAMLKAKAHPELDYRVVRGATCPADPMTSY